MALARCPPIPPLAKASAANRSYHQYNVHPGLETGIPIQVVISVSLAGKNLKLTSNAEVGVFLSV
jgi:hypothetical protein